MFWKKILTEKSTVLQVSIGSEGAVVLYIRGDVIEQRLFIRTTSRHDTAKLIQILEQDKDVAVHIYLDTLDQTYIQRNIPFVLTFSSSKIAQQRIAKEVPEDYLKVCIKLGQTAVGRKDWIYTFVSAPYEPPFSQWIDFFLYHHSVIEGIYFLPVELSRMLPFLRGTRALDKESKSWLNTVLHTHSKLKHFGWEILITQSKASGFRQTVFYNGRIVLSRVLVGIKSADPAIVAGDIELEVTNSLEYLANVFMGFYDKQIDVYIIMSDEICSQIRRDKLPKHTKIYTPYNFAKLVGVVECSEYDKFVDPFILAAFVESKDIVKRVYIQMSERLYLARKYLYILRGMTHGLVAIFAFLLISNIYNMISYEIEIFDYKNEIQQARWDVEDVKHEISELSKHQNIGININKVLEIVDVHKFFDDKHISNENALSLISKSLPADIRVGSIQWYLSDPALSSIIPNLQLHNFHSYRVDIIFSAYFKNPKANQDYYYENFKSDIQAKFPDYKTIFSPLLYDNVGEGKDKYNMFRTKIVLNSNDLKES
jgi:cell division protein FtsL